ncbi:MAG TPA: endonuclease/exonuclease/phosphatase family protein [Candidatus Gallibacteroides avistercoris]|uniref:Endonuclease/exonuclease/phosphatase family protein n=1 Tax=Candidatus Gallibacteroides avistercoris TaxID=2840833 RepID=A0A9D1SD25_9BACT|nr:endonuclease/exonuclease/phosphatase family protein [Candidatus Gallibacteroides avistercoris]
MKKLILLVAICLIPLSAIEAKKKCQMNIASFNLRMDTESDKENAWKYRKDFVCALVNFHDFDIFGTQEGFTHQLNDLTRSGEYAYVGVGRDDGKDEGEHSAILYKTSRFQVLKQGNFWFSETPEEPSYGWDAEIRRICSWAQFKDKISGKKFYFFNVHYDHIAPIARRESSKLLLQRIKEIAGDAPVFCTGDFNADETSEPIQLIYNDGLLKDSYRITATPPYGPVGTWHDYNLDTKYDRIDYIFVTDGITIHKYGALSDNLHRKLPSDHYPIMVEAEF